MCLKTGKVFVLKMHIEGIKKLILFEQKVLKIRNLVLDHLYIEQKRCLNKNTEYIIINKNIRKLK